LITPETTPPPIPTNSATAPILGTILAVIGVFYLFIGLASIGAPKPTGTPTGSNPFLDSFLTNFAIFGSASFIATGFTLIVFGQLLQLMIDIAKDTRVIAQNSAETTAFFSRVSNKAA
jgi:hypothetical protein